jgi:hypothetical protein
LRRLTPLRNNPSLDSNMIAKGLTILVARRSSEINGLRIWLPGLIRTETFRNSPR